MTFFRKKPVVIEAVQWTGDNPDEVREFLGSSGWEPQLDLRSTYSESNRLEIFTLEGVMQASPGDWIIRGVRGEFYPCKPDIFEQTYEEVEEDAQA